MGKKNHKHFRQSSEVFSSALEKSEKKLLLAVII
jgi:hypothetical protein